MQASIDQAPRSDRSYASASLLARLPRESTLFAEHDTKKIGETIAGQCQPLFGRRNAVAQIGGRRWFRSFGRRLARRVGAIAERAGERVALVGPPRDRLGVGRLELCEGSAWIDRKSTRLNSSH